MLYVENTHVVCKQQQTNWQPNNQILELTAYVVAACVQVLADLRVVLETMEEPDTYFGGLDGVEELAKLQRLLDPFEGLPRAAIHR